MSPVDLSDYVEVPDRIREFIDKYPDGSLQCRRVEYREMPAAHLKGESCMHVIYHAAAYRTPDDSRPGEGMASEPLPGLTPYTKGSELMNAETSAWGRALVALGFVSKKVASANEVRARQSVQGAADTARKGAPYTTETIDPSPAQIKLVKKLVTEKRASRSELDALLKAVGADFVAEPGWTDRLTGGRDGTASALITWLKENPLPTGVSDVPSDTSDFDSPAVLDDVFVEAK